MYIYFCKYGKTCTLNRPKDVNSDRITASSHNVHRNVNPNQLQITKIILGNKMKIAAVKGDAAKRGCPF